MTYYGVNAVKENGNFVGRATGSQPRFGDSDILVGIVNNGVWAVASNLSDEKEYSHFYDTYCNGVWLNFELYTIPRAEESKFPDEGRVPVRGPTAEELFPGVEDVDFGSGNPGER